MYKARYYKTDGKKGRARELPESLFDGVVNKVVLHQVVQAHLANRRQGTGSAKNRSAVRGGSRKPWRQKGTGRARQGSIRSVQWAGGGRAFPPIPHSWRKRVPRKVKALARRSAFNARAEEDRVVLIDGISMEAPKTKEVRQYLETIELRDRKVLLLTDGLKETVYLSVRNMPQVEIRPFGEESPYDILWADVVVIEREVVDGLTGKAAETEKEAPEEEPAAEEAEAPEAEAAETEDEFEAEEAEEDEEAPEAADEDQEEKSDG